MTARIPLQRFIVDLPVGTARRALALLNTKGGYADLNELLTVALENQLRLEDGPMPPVEPENAPPADREASGDTQMDSRRAAQKLPVPGLRSAFADLAEEALLQVPDVSRVGAPKAIPGNNPLSAFTNRLTPFVVPVRILTNTMALSGPPTVDDFIHRTPAIARRIGLWLKQEDAEHGRRGRLRRWTAWPVGDDEIASLSRYRKSFLFGMEAGRVAGPLLDLGLAVVVESRVVPTERAVQIAGDKTVLLGEVEDGPLLSTGQQERLRSALFEVEGERAEIKMFFKAVREAEGAQGMVDRLIAAAHSGWTEAQVVSHRAAMIGRLRDVGLVDVSTPPPGKEVEILLEPPAEECLRALGLRR